MTFVPDAVRAIVGHVAPSSENFESLRTLAIAEVPARGAEMSKLVACLKSLQISDIRDEVEALWTSVSRFVWILTGASCWCPGERTSQRTG